MRIFLLPLVRLGRAGLLEYDNAGRGRVKASEGV
jgi:hypothetical protein